MRFWRLALTVTALGLAQLACFDASERPPLVFTPDELPAAQAGQAYQSAITVQQNVTPVGDIYVADGELPPGLTLVFEEGGETAELTGTPGQAGTFEFTVGAWCLGTNVSGQTGEKTYRLVVE